MNFAPTGSSHYLGLECSSIRLVAPSYRRFVNPRAAYDSFLAPGLVSRTPGSERLSYCDEYAGGDFEV